MHYKISNSLKFVQRIPLQFKWAYQRVVRGYSDKDMWNSDRYIASILAGTLDWFVYKGNSISSFYLCPPLLDDLDKAIIRRDTEYLHYSKIFQEYAKNGPACDKKWKKEFGGVLDEDMQDALQWLSKHFQELWD